MTPPMQPTLADEHVLLRPMTADDWDGLYLVAADPLIWELHPAHDPRLHREGGRHAELLPGGISTEEDALSARAGEVELVAHDAEQPGEVGISQISLGAEDAGGVAGQAKLPVVDPARIAAAENVSVRAIDGCFLVAGDDVGARAMEKGQ